MEEIFRGLTLIITNLTLQGVLDPRQSRTRSLAGHRFSTYDGIRCSTRARFVKVEFETNCAPAEYCTIPTNPAGGWLMTKKLELIHSGGGPDDGESMARWAAPRMATTELTQAESPDRKEIDDIKLSPAAVDPLMTDDSDQDLPVQVPSRPCSLSLVPYLRRRTTD
jgi:hypothetical protein